MTWTARRFFPRNFYTFIFIEMPSTIFGAALTVWHAIHNFTKLTILITDSDEMQ